MSDEHQFEEEEFDTQFNGQTVLRIIKQGFRHWPLMIIFLLSISMVSILDSYFTFLSKRIMDEGIIAGNVEVLTGIVIQYGLLIILQSVMVFGFIVAAGMLSERVQYDLRKRMFGRLQELSLSYFDTTPVGWLMSRVTSDTQRVGDLVSWGFLDITWGTANILSALFFMFIISWKLTLIVLVMIPILIVTAGLFKKKILVEYRKVRKINSKITGSYNENITGVRVVKALRREEANAAEFGELTTDMYDAGFRAAWLSALFLPAVQLITAVAIGAVVVFGGYQFQLGGLTIGGMQAFISYILFMMWPVQEMARVYAEMQQSVASGERIFSLVDAVPEIQDRENALDPGTLRGDIVFDQVDFYYEKEKPILTDFNLTIKQGETIALVGPTGAGKSTLVNLICRFYEPQGGTIRIAGTDYQDLTLHSIHSRIGMVLQTPHLFSGTVMDNLRYGRLDATDEEVIDAAKLAGADEFINKLEEKYHTQVGEGGVLLSVGQKQLISLARAVLSEPDIFIMDEATSSVDTLTEALIQQGMDKLMEGRTSFVIAHRLSTIKRADRILVIENGGVAEMGTHGELIRKRGHYYDLYTKQFRDQMESAFDSLDELPEGELALV
ncbi:MAG: ATP-binding cassette domain-containing protein [Aquificales bacterium]|nr:ATP-binding cassette domain-containing protein [Aquificales bacterium]